eukprot:1161012-Pelagomonas_calceolata.AAC.3
MEAAAGGASWKLLTWMDMLWMDQRGALSAQTQKEHDKHTGSRTTPYIIKKKRILGAKTQLKKARVMHCLLKMPVPHRRLSCKAIMHVRLCAPRRSAASIKRTPGDPRPWRSKTMQAQQPCSKFRSESGAYASAAPLRPY